MTQTYYLSGDTLAFSDSTCRFHKHCRQTSWRAFILVHTPFSFVSNFEKTAGGQRVSNLISVFSNWIIITWTSCESCIR